MKKIVLNFRQKLVLAALDLIAAIWISNSIPLLRSWWGLPAFASPFIIGLVFFIGLFANGEIRRRAVVIGGTWLAVMWLRAAFQAWDRTQDLPFGITLFLIGVAVMVYELFVDFD